MLFIHKSSLSKTLRHAVSWRGFSATGKSMTGTAISGKSMAGKLPKEISIPVPYGSIAGKIWNEGGSPILGLHGWMDNAGTWDEVAPLLPENMSLISIDFPGHGLSDLPFSQGSSNFLDLVVIIERVVRHFGLEEVNILGHSMGGGAAFLYAATFPEKVKKIVMVDLVKPISVEPQKQPARTARAVKELFEAEAKCGKEAPCYDYQTLVERMVAGYNNNLTEKSAKILLKRGAKQLENGLYSFSFDPRIKATNIVSTTFEQQKAFARNLKCEMMIIKASKGPWYEDKTLYDEALSIYEENAKVFKFVTLEGTHHIHLNDPEKVAPVIIDFFNSPS